MAIKFVLFAATLALANAGLLAPAAYAPGPAIAAPAIAYHAGPTYASYPAAQTYTSYPGYSLSAQAPAITSQSSNILRSFGNLGQVSTYSKTIDTPFSSVSKSDVRVSNPGLRYAAAPIGYAPSLGYQAQTIAAPAAIGVAYSPATAVSHVTYQGLGANYGW